MGQGISTPSGGCSIYHQIDANNMEMTIHITLADEGDNKFRLERVDAAVFERQTRCPSLILHYY